MFGLSGNSRPWHTVVGDMIERKSPLYHAYVQGSEQDSDILSLMALVDGNQPMPITFFSAVNMLLFRDQFHPLARFYPFLTPVPARAQEAFPDFRHFVPTHTEELRSLLPHFRLQTNETMRCANLLPAFELVSRRGGRKPLAMIEIGTSAGLNLSWDKYSYRFIGPSQTRGAGDPSVSVIIACMVENTDLLPLPLSMPLVAERIGIDLSPLDVSNERDVRQLQGAIWPEETARYFLLGESLSFARQQPSPRILKGEASTLLPEILSAIPETFTICVSHSYALLVAWLSKQSGQSKAFGVMGAVLMMGAFLILAWVPDWNWILLAAVLFGAGFGSHVGIVLALAVHFLMPTRHESGTQLGVLHTAIFVALILSPQIGGFLLSTFANNFAALFLVGSATSVLAGVMLLGVKQARGEAKGSQTVLSIGEEVR